MTDSFVYFKKENNNFLIFNQNIIDANINKKIKICLSLATDPHLF